MKAWEMLSNDEKIKHINDEVHALFGFIEGKFNGVDSRFDDVTRRFDAIDRRLDAIERRFDNLERENDRTHKVLRSLSGRIMFVEQTNFYIFGQVLPDDAKERIVAEAESSLNSLRDHLDEEMYSGIVESHSMMKQHFEVH